MNKMLLGILIMVVIICITLLYQWATAPSGKTLPPNNNYEVNDFEKY